MDGWVRYKRPHRIRRPAEDGEIISIDRWNEEQGRPRDTDKLFDDPSDFEPKEDNDE